MMGIGAGMGIPPAVTAGMVISGSFFGDKMSPISDTTNLAPASAGTTLYKHIGAIWKTTLPAYLTTFGCFTVLGFFYQGGRWTTLPLICLLTPSAPISALPRCFFCPWWYCWC